MRFPNQIYLFDLVKGSHRFCFENKVENFEVKFQETTIRISKQNCEVLFHSLQKLGFVLDGC